MLRSALLSILLLVPTGLGGCTMAHTQVVPLPPQAAEGDTPPAIEPIAHIYGNVYGYDLFGIPLTSGAARHKNRRIIAWFEDSVHVPAVTEMLLAEARELEATHIIDLQTNFLSSWLQWLFVLWMPEVQGSATAIRVHHGPPPPGAIAVGDAPDDDER